MSTQYPVYSDDRIDIQLDESSCKFQLEVSLVRESYSSKRLTEDQVIEIAASLLGPLFYHNPGPEVLQKFTKRLEERGYL